MLDTVFSSNAKQIRQKIPSALLNVRGSMFGYARLFSLIKKVLRYRIAKIHYKISCNKHK